MNSQTLEISVPNGEEMQESLKRAVIELVKSDAGLSAEYQKKMDEAFDFLDPEDPRRINASDLDNLQTWSVSPWTPSHSFRYGQGDYNFCTNPDEVASYDMGTVIVGFDTSYKREETYGFWAVYYYEYNWCDVNDQTTKAKMTITHKKWVPRDQVDLFVY